MRPSAKFLIDVTGDGAARAPGPPECAFLQGCAGCDSLVLPLKTGIGSCQDQVNLGTHNDLSNPFFFPHEVRARVQSLCSNVMMEQCLRGASACLKVYCFEGLGAQN